LERDERHTPNHLRRDQSPRDTRTAEPTDPDRSRTRIHPLRLGDAIVKRPEGAASDGLAVDGSRHDESRLRSTDVIWIEWGLAAGSGDGGQRRGESSMSAWASPEPGSSIDLVIIRRS